MKETEATKARQEEAERQERIKKQWANFANVTGREAYADLIEWMTAERNNAIQYGENMAMPHPQTGQLMPLDLEICSILLQRSRVYSTVKTYIQSRVDPDVAQSKTK